MAMDWQERATMARADIPRHPVPVGDLLRNVRYAPLWLLPRVALGWLSLQAGWGLLRELPASAGLAGGNALAVGLTLAGIALILGLFTGPAAIVAGVLGAGLWASGNIALAALYLALVIWLALTWRSAGWIGLDRWVLPLIGVAGRGGALVRTGRRTE